MPWTTTRATPRSRSADASCWPPAPVPSAVAHCSSQQHHATKSWPHGTPLRVDLAGLPEGKLKTVEWQGKPVWVLRRRPAEIEALQRGRRGARRCRVPRIAATPYTRNALRSRAPRSSSRSACATHQGCTPALNGDHFLCPATSKYDLAGPRLQGRAGAGQPGHSAYRFDGDNTLILGEDA